MKTYKPWQKYTNVALRSMKRMLDTADRMMREGRTSAEYEAYAAKERLRLKRDLLILDGRNFRTMPCNNRAAEARFREQINSEMERMKEAADQ